MFEAPDFYSHGTKIQDRELRFCPSRAPLSPYENITTCVSCGAFSIFCCAHNDESATKDLACHHFKLIMVDGACPGNGGPNARAGVGIAWGNRPSMQYSLPLTDVEDPGQKRSNQRAELYAALRALVLYSDNCKADLRREALEASSRHADLKTSSEWIIASDSEYLVKGMTEWLPKWKNQGMRLNNGSVPANLDLFVAIDEQMVELEERFPCVIGFWHIRREFNTLADELAREGAEMV
ncbi:hypothetical protein FKW77_001542 [Venturia effusa]|uniref:ribonuclease H n=1 Tax=Venturia effusa TaxID=50376 RepID=A0A517L8N1_9PEZI|nr:hypothetical protein FKW77_001542 [Venturia effusa]